MKRIPVGAKYFALVDDEDYEDLMQFKWRIQKDVDSRTLYAKRRFVQDSNEHMELMHKRITGYEITDHINHDGLDNRRSNLRQATHSQNQANKVKQRGEYSSTYKGVYFEKLTGKWRAQITFQGKNKKLGGFADEIRAAKAYDIAAKEYFGEFANLNFPEAS